MQSILGNNTRKADIVFYSSGKIDISAYVAKHLQLVRGDVIDIMLDSGEYYLYVKRRSSDNGRYEAMVFPTNKRGHHYRAYSQKLCSVLLRDSGAVDIARLCVGHPIENEYGKLLPIIIKRLL